MDLRFIEYALAAAKYGSFRQAARSLDVVESTVSRRVRILEDSLGFPLFRRSIDGVQLTESGRIFLEDARLGVDRINRAIDHAWRKQEGRCDRIEIGIVESLSRDELRTPLSEFQQRHVAMRIQIRFGTQFELEKRLGERLLDIAVLPGERVMPGYHRLVLWREPVLLALPASWPVPAGEDVSLTQLHSRRFLVSATGLGPDIKQCLTRELQIQQVSAEIEIHDVGVAEILDMVEFGMGATIVVGHPQKKRPGAVRYATLAGLEKKMEWAAHWRVNNDNPALRRLVHFLRKMEPTDP